MRPTVTPPASDEDASAPPVADADVISVLVVDDDEQYTEMTSEHLALEDDIEPLTAVDPEAALETIERERVDCVVSDYRMGRMDGIELMRAVRERVGDIPFIIATGAGSEDVASEAISAGVTDYVRKGRGRPRELLINRIRNAVRRDRAQRVANQYQSIVRALDAPSFTVDTDGEVVFADDALSEMTGHPLADLLGDTCERFLRDHDGVLAGGDPDGGLSARVEATVVTTDDDEIPCEILLGPVREGGAVVGYAGILQDVSERIERERELQEYERIVENTTDAIAVKDPDGRYLLANEAMGELLSVDLDGLVGRTGEAVGDPATAATFRRRERAALETAETQEVREEVTVDGERRTFQTTRIPHERPGGGRSVIVIHRDVTEVTRHERRLDRLHEVSRDLLAATDSDEVGEELAAAAADIGTDLSAAVYLYDESANRLHPAATAGRPREAESVAPGDGPVWRAFVENSPVHVGEVEDAGRDADPTAGAALAVPIGGHGVLHVHSGSLSDSVVEATSVLAANAESVLDRTTQLETVRERERALEDRNDRLRRMESLAGALTDVVETAVGAEPSTAVFRQVCDRITDEPAARFAWIGRRRDGEVVPVAWSGTGQGYLDDASLALDGATPAARAVAEDRTVEVATVADAPRRADWRGPALTNGFQSLLVVPLPTEDGGVLAVYGDRPEAFRDPERTATETVARLLGGRLADLERAAVSLPGPLDELEVRAAEPGSPLATLARALDEEVRVTAYVPEDDTVRARFETPADPEDVAETAGTVVGLTDVEVGEDEHAATLTAGSLAQRLAARGAVVRQVRHEPRETHVDLLAPGPRGPVTGVRTLIEDRDDVDLVSRTAGTTLADGAGGRSPMDSLTDRQREVLWAAHEAGFFEWPREANGDEVADRLGIAAPTFHEHIRRAERGLIEQMES